MNHHTALKEKVECQIKRIKKAERERPHLISQTIYIGTLGLVMVLPVVAGVYLGRWVDSLLEGYSVRWTLSLLITGVVIGFFNVYYLIKE